MNASVFFILGFFSITAHGLTTDSPLTPEDLIEYSRVEIARYVTKAFVNRLKEQRTPCPTFHPRTSSKSASISEQESRCSLIPPILNDPYDLQDWDQQLDWNLPTIVLSSGLCEHRSRQLSGLSNLTDNFLFESLIDISINWDIHLPYLEMKGKYNLNQTLTSDLIFTGIEGPGPHHMTGKGDLVGSVQDVFFHLQATGSLIGKIRLHELSVDFGFQNLTIFMENAFYDGDVPFSVDKIPPVLEKIFHTYIWSDLTRDYVNEVTRCAINYVIADCTLMQIIEGHGDECLKLDIGFFHCFTPVTTVHTEPTIPTASTEPSSTTPKDESSSTTPKDERSSTTPKYGISSTTPKPERSSTTPKGEISSTTPKYGMSSTTPKPERSSTTPKGEISSTTPKNEGSSTTPEGKGSSTTPKDDSSSTTAKDEGSSTPTTMESSGALSFAGFGHMIISVVIGMSCNGYWKL